MTFITLLSVHLILFLYPSKWKELQENLIIYRCVLALLYSKSEGGYKGWGHYCPIGSINGTVCPAPDKVGADGAEVYCGQDAGMITGIVGAGEVVPGIIADSEAALVKLNKLLALKVTDSQLKVVFRPGFLTDERDKAAAP